MNGDGWGGRQVGNEVRGQSDGVLVKGGRPFPLKGRKAFLLLLLKLIRLQGRESETVSDWERGLAWERQGSNRRTSFQLSAFPYPSVYLHTKNDV